MIQANPVNGRLKKKQKKNLGITWGRGRKIQNKVEKRKEKKKPKLSERREGKKKDSFSSVS